jgi:hypothetical protein
MTYNTLKYAGKFDKTVTISYGPEGKEETVVHLKGYVDPIPMGVMELVPRKTEVGELQLNQPNKTTIVLKNAGDAPLTLTRIASQKFGTVYFDGGQSGNIVIEAGKEHPLTLTLTPTEAGRYLDSLLIFSDARNDIGKGYKGILSGTVK